MSCFMGPNLQCTSNLEGAMVSTTHGEKAEVQALNSRLAQYIQMLSNIKLESSASVDSSKYQQALTMLESELCKLKAMYEAELNKLRCQLERVTKEKTTITSSMETNSSAYNEMCCKLNVALESIKKLQMEISRLSQSLAQKEKENSELRAQLKIYITELEQIKPNYGCMSGELDTLRARLEQEIKCRKEAEYKLSQLNQKQKFDGNVICQENHDLQARLKVVNEICMKLELKIRQLSQSGGEDLAILLQKLRDANVAELKRYQRETEEALNKTLGALQCNMQQNVHSKEKIVKEKIRLEECVGQLQLQINHLQGENQGLQQQLVTITGTLHSEQSSSTTTIQSLEGKIQQLEAAMMCSAKEFVNARDAQVTLKTEINQYRNLLEMGQQKMAERPRPVTCGPAQTFNVNTHCNTGGSYSPQVVCPSRPPTSDGRPSSMCYRKPPPAIKCGSGGRCHCGGKCGGGGQSQSISFEYKPGALFADTEYNSRYGCGSVATSLPGIGGPVYKSSGQTWRKW